jgi:hypothetical protein
MYVNRTRVTWHDVRELASIALAISFSDSTAGSESFDKLSRFAVSRRFCLAILQNLSLPQAGLSCCTPEPIGVFSHLPIRLTRTGGLRDA